MGAYGKLIKIKATKTSASRPSAFQQNHQSYLALALYSLCHRPEEMNKPRKCLPGTLSCPLKLPDRRRRIQTQKIFPNQPPFFQETSFCFVFAKFRMKSTRLAHSLAVVNLCQPLWKDVHGCRPPSIEPSVTVAAHVAKPQQARHRQSERQKWLNA